MPSTTDPSDPSCDPLLEVPDCNYVKVQSLSAGAFGFVQHARHKHTNRDVAIKFMRHIHQGPASNKYVEAELLNHRMLRHPHVIQFKEVFLTPNYICIVMEFASGGSLFSHVQRAGRLREATARWFFQQLIVGLDYCHRKGVVNRDIKLENTLLKVVQGLPLPLVKICDFGYSKANNMSAPKSKVGTIAYMAPEVLEADAGDRYDGKLADIWSCGVMLYVMLCNRYPFDIQKGCAAGGAGDQRVVDNICNARWSLPRDLQISDECRDLLDKLLVRDPSKRMDMAGVLQHTWFRSNLPEKALHMNNNLIGREDYTGVQTEAEIQAVLRHAQEMTLAEAGGEELEDEDTLIDAAIDDEMVENMQSFNLQSR